MKSKEQSIVKRVIALLEEKPRTPKELQKDLGIVGNGVHVALYTLRRKGLVFRDNGKRYYLHKHSKAARKQKPVKVAAPKDTLKAEIDNLKAENDKLNNWCLDWRKKYEGREEQNRQFRNMYADARAVIHYLESKIAELIKQK